MILIWVFKGLNKTLKSLLCFLKISESFLILFSSLREGNNGGLEGDYVSLVKLKTEEQEEVKMSAKILHALSDENPDLKKQIGCMTGIFQLFDRHHVFTGRRIAAQTHKKLPSAHSQLNNGNGDGEVETVRYVQSALEKNQNKNVGENQRISMDSSRASLTSSCSSSFSSLDYKTSQPESQCSERTIYPDTPLRDPPGNQPNVSKLGRHSLDFRDVVKDSIYRDTHGLSVKTTTKQEPANRVMKHKDSPRPLQLSKSVGESFLVGANAKSRVSVDLNESIKVPAKLREPPFYLHDSGERLRSPHGARDGSLASTTKDTPRFSYDGREARRSSFESRDALKPITKLRELPRLSLDSRDGYMKSSKFDPKDLQRSGSCNYARSPNLQQEPGSYKRPPSVVAKLMGLDILPNSISIPESQIGFIKTCHNEECDLSTRSSKANDESKQSRTASPRSSPRGMVQPRLKTPDSVVKPASRFPIESAPWKQLDGVRGSQKPVSRNQEVTTKTVNSHPSVYAEIEKRLKELEFRQSDRDLRALKQILDAMQVKGLLESKKQDRASHFVSQRTENNLDQRAVDQNPRSVNKQNSLSNCLISSTAKGSSPQRDFGSPIVIMKPAKLIGKSGMPATSVIPVDSLSGLCKPQITVNSKKGTVNNRMRRELTPKVSHKDAVNRTLGSPDRKDKARTTRSSETSTKSQQLSRESIGSSGRTSGSVSPRLQQKKLELEKRSSRPPIPSFDSSKPRRQSTGQPAESGSPCGRTRSRTSGFQGSDDQMSETSRDRRHQRDDISLQSDSNDSFMSCMDIEVTSTDRSAEMGSILYQQGNQRPSRKVAKNSIKHNKPTPRLSEDGLLAELATIAQEQPSPVSVLDASFYRDELPSPVKKITHALEDVETRNSSDHPSEDEWNPERFHCLSASSSVNSRKLENVGYLVQKLRGLNSNHNEATTDYIASLCESTNPDHRYISEIVLASGLILRDLGSGLKAIQLHPSGHPINPDLFFVLEQTKMRNRLNCDKAVQMKSDKDKLHRKLVFDAVNEVLVQKLALAGLSAETWNRTNNVAWRNVNAQKLLKDLCSEIERLQTNTKAECNLDDEEDSLKKILLEDVKQGSENWVEYSKEVPQVALDVERLIFKDLIDEIVNGEAVNQQAKMNRECRQ